MDLNVLYHDPKTLITTMIPDTKPGESGNKTDYVFMTDGISKSQAEQLQNTARIMNITGKLYKTV